MSTILWLQTLFWLGRCAKPYHSRYRAKLLQPQQLQYCEVCSLPVGRRIFIEVERAAEAMLPPLPRMRTRIALITWCPQSIETTLTIPTVRSDLLEQDSKGQTWKLLQQFRKDREGGGGFAESHVLSAAQAYKIALGNI
jgi:hypothetical protein